MPGNSEAGYAGRVETTTGVGLKGSFISWGRVGPINPPHVIPSMKSITATLLASALAVVVPSIVCAQAGSSGSSSANPHPSTSSNYGQSSDKSLSSAEMKTITNDQLDRQVTAKNLIGTDVHGAGDKKIGSVVDIVLAPGHGKDKGSRATSDTRTSSALDPELGAVGSTARVDGSKPAGAIDKAAGAIMAMQPSVVVSTGGMMGIGNDLVQVPLAKVSYDADAKRIRLNVTESEWNALRDSRTSGGVSSTR